MEKRFKKHFHDNQRYKKLKKLFILFLITFSLTAYAVEIIPLKETFWQKIWRCKISISCYNALGSTITNIAGGDIISSSRTTINTNFTNLNNGKIEVSTTTLPLITTLSGLTSATSLSTVGTIITGTWSATSIAVGKGGTGTTSPSAYFVLLGDGTNGITIASSTGSSGQFLTSNGAGAYPSWQTSAVSQSINYNFTSSYFGVKNLNASSTSANPLVLNGVSINTPSTQGASSTVWVNDGTGKFISEKPNMEFLAGVKLAGASTTVTLSIPQRLSYYIQFLSEKEAGGNLLFQINNDATANAYKLSSFVNRGAKETATSTSFQISNNDATNAVVNGEITINNASTTRPRISGWASQEAQNGNMGNLLEFWGNYDNLTNASIHSFDFTKTSGLFYATSSVIKVWAINDNI
jgi:hypothetical protein